MKYRTCLQKFVVYALCAWMAVCDVLPAAAQDCDPDKDPNCGVYALLPKQPPPAPATDMSQLSSYDTMNWAYDVATKGKADPTGEVMDVTIAAITIGYPPAGVILGGLKALITSGATQPDPVGEALAALGQRINDLNTRLGLLEGKVAAIQDQQFNDENRARKRELYRVDGVIASKASQLKTEKPSPRELPTLLVDIQQVADEFILDTDLWQWSDLEVQTDKSGNVSSHGVAPDFKALPTFESYTHALVLWMSALEYASAGNPSYVTSNKTLVQSLLRHAAFLSIEPTFRELENGDVHTIAEQVLRSIRCSMSVNDKYPDAKTGLCHVDYGCVDYQRHTSLGVGGTMEFQNFNPRETCQLSIRDAAFTPSAKQLSDLRKNPLFGSDAMTLWQQWDAERRALPAALMGTQQELQCQNGIEAMTLLADRLVRLARTGSSEPPLQLTGGRFDMRFYDQEFLYGVKANGELMWYRDESVVDKNPPNQEPAKLQYESVLSTPCGTVTQAPPAGPLDRKQMQSSAVRGLAATQQTNNRLNTPASAGVRARSMQHSGGTARPDLNRMVASPGGIMNQGPTVIHKLEGPKLVGSGWQNFRQVIPAGASGFYGLTADGTLMWYKHTGFADGSPTWAGPIRVATGWNVFKTIIAGGDGVLYGIGADGSLQWYRHGDYLDATHQLPLMGGPSSRPVSRATGTATNIQGPRPVGTGWGNFVHVFSTGQGVIYAITADGRLLWYRHLGYLTGQPQWEGPKQIGSGWGNMKRVFSPGLGIIYAMPASGELIWYKNDGYLDGTPTWLGPKKVAADWGSFVHVFPRMGAAPDSSQIH